MSSTWMKVPAVFLTAILIGIGSFWFVNLLAGGGVVSATPTTSASSSATEPKQTPIVAASKPSTSECQAFSDFWNSDLKNVVGNMAWLNQNGTVDASLASSDFTHLHEMLTDQDRYSVALSDDANQLSYTPYDSNLAATYIVDENMFEMQCGITYN